MNLFIKTHNKTPRNGDEYLEDFVTIQSHESLVVFLDGNPFSKDALQGDGAVMEYLIIK